MGLLNQGYFNSREGGWEEENSELKLCEGMQHFQSAPHLSNS